jgi:hypothetical protein
MRLPLSLIVLLLMKSLISSHSAVNPAGQAPPESGFPVATKNVQLAAGPIRLTFADGELRRLYVGDREIIRRVYVTVRDPRWDTAEPKITQVDIRQSKDSFAIQLEALCRDKGIDFTWRGEITGTTAGKITFRVQGAANAACRANRFGMCVLFGAESLAGQTYEVHDAQGSSRTDVFPVLLDKIILQNRFGSLSYQTAEGLIVTTAVEGTHFGMEDQRQFGDSSFKAFSAMPFPYPQITAGAAGSETISIQVETAKGTIRRPPTHVIQKPVVVHLGDPLPGARLPRLLPYDKALAKSGFFMDISNARKTLAETPLIAWPFNVAVNLFDEETWIENLSAVADQVRTARHIAPRATLRVAPVSFNAPYPRERRDPRNQEVFAAAWTAAAIKYLALAGADEAMFDVGPGFADTVLRTMSGYQGKQLLATTVTADAGLPFEAMAFPDQNSTFLCLINLASQPRAIRLEGLPGSPDLELRRITAETPPPASPRGEKMKAIRGRCAMSLSPFEVCLVRLARKP